MPGPPFRDVGNPGSDGLHDREVRHGARERGMDDPGAETGEPGHECVSSRARCQGESEDEKGV